MLDIIYALFQTIIHGIETLLNMILSIPTYVSFIRTWVGLMPTAITVPISIIVLSSTLIAIKRLVF